MVSSPESDPNSSEMSIIPKEQPGFVVSSDSHTDPAEDNRNDSSEEYTDSDTDSNPGIAVGGCGVIDLEDAPLETVQKVDEGITAAIDDFNQRHGSTYKLVEIEEVLQTVCSGYAFSLYFTAKPADSRDNLLTKFEAVVWFVLPDYELQYVQCEAKSFERAAEAA